MCGALAPFVCFPSGAALFFKNLGGETKENSEPKIGNTH